LNLEGVVVVGYGNPLRGDDGVGCRVAELVRDDPRLAGARVETRHQLTPEWAEDVARARLVVLVDAAVGGGPAAGGVRVEAVSVGEQAQPHAFAGSHVVDAGIIVRLAVRLYGRAAPVLLVRVAAARFEPGTGVSPTVEATLPLAVDTVAAVIARHLARDRDDDGARPIARPDVPPTDSVPHECTFLCVPPALCWEEGGWIATGR
jgi:hydrogenase maturation protease